MALPTITFSLLPQSVREDGGGAFVYTFTRTGDLSAPLTVAYKLAGTATPGTDFTFSSPSVTFQAGSATATLTITPKADTVVEPDETVSVELIPSYTIGTVGAVAGTIANDDVAQATTTSLFTTQIPSQPNFTDGPTTDWECGMKFSAGAPGEIRAIRYFKAAGESGAHTGRIWSSTGALLASVAFTNETASSWQQQALATPLTIAANTTYTVSVNVRSHYALTPSGFNAQIANGGLVAAVGAGVYNESQGVFPSLVYQNENYFRDVVFLATGPVSPPAPVVTVAIAPTSVLEDGVPNLVYTFTRTGATTAPLTVNYTISGTATNGSDYTGISTTGTTKIVTFVAGSATAVVNVDPITDAAVEPDETVALTLAAGAGYTIGTPGAATGTIRNDDIDPITVLRKGWELTASNTGLAAYGIIGSQLPLYTGPNKIPAGSRISGVRFANGAIELSAGDIIIEKSLFQPTWAGAGLPLVTTVDFNQFKPVPSKVIIRDCEIDGSLLKSNRADFSDQRFKASVSGFEGIADLQRNYIHNVGTGIVLRYAGTQLDSLIEGNYVDNLVAWGDAGTTGSHNNAISIRDFSDDQRPGRKAIVRNNRFELDTPGNASSSIQIAGHDGRVENVTVEGNLLEGYGYNLWLSTSNYGFGNMAAIDNRFGTWSPGYGPSYSDSPGWSTWQGNYIYNPSMPDGRGALINR